MPSQSQPEENPSPQNLSSEGQLDLFPEFEVQPPVPAPAVPAPVTPPPPAAAKPKPITDPTPPTDVWSKLKRPHVTARYFFCGEPAEYAAFFGPQPTLPHLLVGEGPVVLGATPPAFTTLEPYTGPKTAGLPFLLAPLSHDGARDLKRFEAELLRVDLADRAERAFACSMAITQWRALEHESDSVELLGLIALEKFIIDNLWREITVSIEGTPPVPLFRTANEFVTKVVRPCLPPKKAKRLSHLRRATRLWLKLRARGHPVPPNVDRLEDLSLRADAIDLYAEIVEHNRGGLPQPWQIETVLEGGSKALKKPKGSLAQTQKAQVLEAVANLSTFAATLKNPILNGLVADVEKAAKGKTVVKQKLTRLKPRLAPELGCPFHFVEVDHELTITVDPLPHPMPYRALAAIPKRAKWIALDLPDGRLGVMVNLDRNPARAQSQREEAYHWAREICAELQCPLPAVAAA
jgi:hypothetical protein